MGNQDHHKETNELQNINGREHHQEEENNIVDNKYQKSEVEEEENQNEGQDQDEKLSVERIFESQEVPAWRKQVTIRAVAVSFGLSILFSFIVMKFNLTTGIVPSLNVSAGLLGFFFVKTWTKLMETTGLLKQPFTRQENTVIQTCVVASSGIAFSGKKLSFVI